jgi:hypothetical protein
MEPRKETNMNEQTRGDKEEYQEMLYNDIVSKVEGLGYILHLDESDVPLIATTKEGYCFWIRVEPCPYDWTREEVEDELKKKGN